MFSFISRRFIKPLITRFRPVRFEVGLFIFMEWFLYSVSILLAIAGIVLCILPIPIPGTLVVLLACVTASFAPDPVFTPNVWGWVILVVLCLSGMLGDNVLVYQVAKRFGASRYGSIGAMVGMFLGFIPLPGPFIVGLFLGPILGALVGELIYSLKTRSAEEKPTSLWGAVFGAVLGVLAGPIFRVAIAIFMIGWFVIDSYLI